MSPPTRIGYVCWLLSGFSVAVIRQLYSSRDRLARYRPNLYQRRHTARLVAEGQFLPLVLRYGVGSSSLLIQKLLVNVP